MRLIQPLATAGVRILAAARVNPLVVVLSHGLLGLASAGLIGLGGSGNLIAAAVLLQLKTLLDNMDGGLARATNRVTQMGRYFDTVIDLVVNVALFAALARYGSIVLALLALVLFTIILSLDYNLERLYNRQRRNPAAPPPDEVPIGAPQPLFRTFERFYRWVLGPQDRLIGDLDARLFGRLYGNPYLQAPHEYRLAWSDLFSTASLVNLGLSSQLFMLGVFLVLGWPFGYVYAVLIQAGYVVAVQLLRIWRFQRYLRS